MEEERTGWRPVREEREKEKKKKKPTARAFPGDRRMGTGEKWRRGEEEENGTKGEDKTGRATKKGERAKQGLNREIRGRGMMPFGRQEDVDDDKS